MRPFLVLTTSLLLALTLTPCQAKENRKVSHYKESRKVSVYKDTRPVSAYKATRIASIYKAASLPGAQHARDFNRNTVRSGLASAQGSRMHALRAAGNARVVARARQLIGIPYRWGGTSEETGFDCSGLLVYLFRTELGVTLPRTTGEMIQDDDSKHVSLAQLKPGDAVFFNRNGSGNVSHVGLYIGNNQFIHAPSTGSSIRMDSLENSYWQRSFTTARRFLG